MKNEVIHSAQLSNLCDRLSEYFLCLSNCPLTSYQDVSDLCNRLCSSDKGVYVFLGGDNPMYVGRSDRIKARISEQMNPKSKPNTSACASEIAKKFTTVHLKTRYPKCRLSVRSIFAIASRKP